MVFDSGQGGELFADKLEAELPVVEVIRVIDWRDAERILKSPRLARRVAEAALKPYIGRVDLIVFANQLLTFTSLRYFRRRYKKQAFVGLGMGVPKTSKRVTVVLTTRAVAKTFYYRLFFLKTRGKIFTFCLDTWPSMIDEGELTPHDAMDEMRERLVQLSNKPERAILLCSHFCELKNEVREVLGRNVNICDGTDEAIRGVYRALGIKGAKKRKK